MYNGPEIGEEKDILKKALHLYFKRVTGLLDMGECLSLDGGNLPSVQAPPISNDGLFLVHIGV